MFTQLAEMLTKASLAMTISAKADVISVTVIPRAKDGEKLSNIPLVFSGTAEELDKKMIPELIKTLGESLGFLTNAADFTTAAKAKEQDAKVAASKKEEAKVTATTAKTTKSSDDKKEKVVATKEQKDAIKKYDKSLAAAGKTKDPDVIDFHKNEIVKLYNKVGLSKEEIITAVTNAFNALKNKINGTSDENQTGSLFTKPADEKTSEEEKTAEDHNQPDEDDDQPDEVLDEADKEENNKSSENVLDADNSTDDDDDIF